MGSERRDATPDVLAATLHARARGENPARLAASTVAADLVERAGDRLRCTACAHRCSFDPVEERAGACGVRFVRDGELRAPFGYVARTYARAVETNTVFHVRPGARALTFGMYGCDLRCPYCHNAHLSQTWDRDGSPEAATPTTPDELVERAVAEGCEVVCSAFNEPMITAEWARAVFTRAKERGLVTVLVSDGHTTPEALRYVRPVADVFRVDLKGTSPAHYKTLGARFEPVIEGIATAREVGFWVEVVTLVVPGFNDDARGLRRVGDVLREIGGGEVPWHLNAFHPRFRMRDRGRTNAGALVSLAGAALARGHRYVYVGNVDDDAPLLAHTRCPACSTEVVQRRGYEVVARTLRDDGSCPSCGAQLPGIWWPERAVVTRTPPSFDPATRS